jgi:hypothetical protein
MKPLDILLLPSFYERASHLGTLGKKEVKWHQKPEQQKKKISKLKFLKIKNFHAWRVLLIK